MSVVKHRQFKEVINVSGTMTALGASSVSPDVIETMASVLPKFVDMVELQRNACRVIQRVIGCEAGFVTACSAAGITVSVAACMTGPNMAKVEQLPDTSAMKDEVILQRGHSIWFGGSIPQMVRLSGARVIELGDVTRAGAYQMEEAITERTAAALYVVSHHTVQYGLINLETFSRVAHSHGVPVIVDAASESNMKVFFERGADLVCYSGHKFLAGPTSGIVAGRTDLIEACLLHQYHGIGRAMKAGKESIVGAIAALERWEQLDHVSILAEQDMVLDAFIDGLSGLPGLTITLEPDPAESPTKRVKVAVDVSVVGLEAFEIADKLKSGDPAIYVRDNETIDGGYFFLDPTCSTLDEARLVAPAIRCVLELPKAEKAAIHLRHTCRPNDADTLVQKFRGWVPEPTE
jgi:L-seryl-tRNA(Ser) seleniumtransferase